MNIIKIKGEEKMDLSLFNDAQRKAVTSIDGCYCVLASAGSGKCIEGDSYIYTNRGIIKIKDPRTLDPLLYAVIFKGCSITDDEIKEIKRMK